jgi:hypothetical protein
VENSFVALDACGWRTIRIRFFSVTVFVTAEVPDSNITVASAVNAAGWPEKVRAIFLPPKTEDRCLRRQLQMIFALKRDLNRPKTSPLVRPHDEE